MLFFIPLKIDRIRFIRENHNEKKKKDKKNDNKIKKKKENKNERKVLFFGLRLG